MTATDAELLDAVRRGQTAAYGLLYRRHFQAACHLARRLARCQADADDLVSAAFAKVLDQLLAGRGPHTAFRGYLLTALRHIAYDRTRLTKNLTVAADLTDYPGVPPEVISVPFTDPAIARLDRMLATKALVALPARWQIVLVHTEIDGRRAAELAPLLGLTPNAVSALAYRARIALRTAFLQQHLNARVNAGCRNTATHLAGADHDLTKEANRLITDLTPEWRKSSYSGTGAAECVEIAHQVHWTAVRDSKNPAGGRLTFGPSNWTSFLSSIRERRC